LLRAAIDSYTRAYRTSPGHYYSGINALTLMHLYQHLIGDERYDADMQIMAGAVRFAAGSESDMAQVFWAKATLGDLEVLVGTPQTVTDVYKEAVAKNENDWFALHSSRSQLALLNELGFNPDRVQAGIAVFDRALAKVNRPEGKWEPRQVILFSGHMIDALDRPRPRFPIDKEDIAAQEIADSLDALGAGAEDLAICQAAAGAPSLRQHGARCGVNATSS
jgi:hypothetical protein